MTIDLDAAVTLATTLPALLVAHTVADYILQTDHQAAHKGQPGWTGRLACLRHVATYTACTAGVVGLLGMLHLASVTWLGLILGQLVSAVTHYWADRRNTLRAFVARFMPWSRHYYDTVPGGAERIDQSWHWFWLLVAALLTALVGA